MKPKVFCMYLPQYHEIPENNSFWGQGFTDWIAVKKALPLFEGHQQPKIPLYNNYYDLEDISSIKWQVELATKSGVDGFVIYHYWFSKEKNVLQKPAENILHNKDIKISFFFAWDNASWKRTWSACYGNDWSPVFDNLDSKENSDNGILLELKYGEESDWEIHFNYLLQFFSDDRYLKINGAPVFSILNNNNVELLNNMMLYWQKLAIKSGFSGIFFIGRKTRTKSLIKYNAEFLYQPHFSAWNNKNIVQKIIKLPKKLLYSRHKMFNERIFDYNKVWLDILKDSKKVGNEPNCYLGAFVNYDDTPRRGSKGKIINNSSPELFRENFKELYKIALDYKKEFIFLTAWNEWGEGAYLEPDINNRYKYLDAIKYVKNCFYL